MGKNQDPGFGINIPDPQHWVPVSQVSDLRIRTLPTVKFLIRSFLPTVSKAPIYTLNPQKVRKRLTIRVVMEGIHNVDP